MPKPYEQVPNEVLKEAVANSDEKPKTGSKKSGSAAKEKKSAPAVTETRQRRIFKRTRAGVELSREEVRSIKEGRKKLRKELRARGIKSKREFELVAGSLGLYFDKRKGSFFWLLGHWLGALIASIIALLVILFIFSAVTQLRGHFTINLSDDMFKEGFVLSDSIGFERPTTELFANPALNVPCISIRAIPADIDNTDGEHNDKYFAYTYYIRNDGESTVDFRWELLLNSESKELSDAAWVMLIRDGEMRFYAEANHETGEKEMIPAKDDDTRGYLTLPIMDIYPESDQFGVVRRINGVPYYRVIPDLFESDKIITSGEVTNVVPGEVHKYTVVLWLEGDDVDTNNTKIGGHLGTHMSFELIRRNGQDVGSDFRNRWEQFWENLRFWEKWTVETDEESGTE
ncbi:MAG: hypothetical protein IK088_03025 [Lachnospiraceae bacterium]|nr:hypothetical protein [Lachnospiraceae bacterium]